jgi:hypothetical protein
MKNGTMATGPLRRPVVIDGGRSPLDTSNTTQPGKGLGKTISWIHRAALKKKAEMIAGALS